MKNVLIFGVLAINAAVVAVATKSVAPGTSPRFVRVPDPLMKQAKTAIEGRVINSDREPIASADVFAQVDGSSSRVFSSLTGKDGNFQLELPEGGTYTISASKEQDGYPLTISGFHQEIPIEIPKVTVAENQVVKDVVVHLGQKAAQLEGTIRDATSNRSVDQATITLRRSDDPKISYTIGAGEPKAQGRFKLLVPTVPFTIEISSPGYEDWTYSDAASQIPDSLRVSRGETKKLLVALRKKAS